MKTQCGVLQFWILTCYRLKKAMAIFMLSLIKETTKKKGISIKKINCDEFRRNADTKRIHIHTLLNCKL